MAKKKNLPLYSIFFLSIPFVLSSIDLLSLVLFHSSHTFIYFQITSIISLFLKESARGFTEVFILYLIIYPIYSIVYIGLCIYFIYIKKILAQKILIVAIVLSLLPVITYRIGDSIEMARFNNLGRESLETGKQIHPMIKYEMLANNNIRYYLTLNDLPRSIDKYIINVSLYVDNTNGPLYYDSIHVTQTSEGIVYIQDGEESKVTQNETFKSAVIATQNSKLERIKFLLTITDDSANSKPYGNLLYEKMLDGIIY